MQTSHAKQIKASQFGDDTVYLPTLRAVLSGEPFQAAARVVVVRGRLAGAAVLTRHRLTGEGAGRVE